MKDTATGATMLTTKIPLTPGPLVVVVKGLWAIPLKPTAIETIAASFVPPKNGSAVRLFNLASDVKFAGLRVAAETTPLADQIQYSLGSNWVPVPTALQTFSAFSDTVPAAAGSNSSRSIAGGTALATAPFTPPSAPMVFTAFLLGDKASGYTLLPQLDAPETGPCKPP